MSNYIATKYRNISAFSILYLSLTLHMALLLISYVRGMKRATSGREFQNRKSRKPLNDFLLGGTAGGRLVFSFENSGQGGPKILSDRLLEFLSHAN